jgi:hypothetical protein
MPGDARGYKGTSKNVPGEANFKVTEQSCRDACGKYPRVIFCGGV